MSPLIALMDDQLRRARECGLRAEALFGPTASSERTRILTAIRAGVVDLLLVAPERLGPGSEVRAALSHTRLSLLVVDEAHCLASWGYDFRRGIGYSRGWGPP